MRQNIHRNKQGDINVKFDTCMLKTEMPGMNETIQNLNRSN